MSAPVLLVIAKEPVPGRSKTRLTPPCTPEEAAALAEAALRDTLAAVAAADAPRRVLVLEGRPGGWLPEGFEVVPQREGGLDERLAGAFDAAGGPAFLVGMDTPQVTVTDIAAGLEAMGRPGVDAVLGGADDGGYWAIGLRTPDPRVFRGVPMSVDDTGAAQRARLGELGLVWAELRSMRDVDDIVDAEAIAAEAPGSEFARALAGIRPGGLAQAPDGEEPVTEAAP